MSESTTGFALNPASDSNIAHPIPRPARSISILGVRVDDVTTEEALALVRQFIDSLAGAPGCDAAGARVCYQIVTPNAEIVTRASSDTNLRRIIAESALAIPDGAGLLLAGRILGTRLREQVTGTDLAVALAEQAARRGDRLFLLGAGEGVAEEAAARLQRRFPGLRIAGTFAGSPDPADDAEAIARIRAAAPVHLLFVAYGASRQEAWIQRNQARAGVPVAIGIGGALDFIAGRVPRAPAWLRRAGFDWLYRLAREPWRWRRQLALPKFALLVARSRLVGGRHDSLGADRLEVDSPRPTH